MSASCRHIGTVYAPTLSRKDCYYATKKVAAPGDDSIVPKEASS